MPGWPFTPNFARFTESGIVAFSFMVRASYTVMVCVYIMFWAVTSPLPDAATDFGEICPVIVARRFSRPCTAGGPVAAGAPAAGAATVAPAAT